MKTKKSAPRHSRNRGDQARERTNVSGQNPKQNDAPDHDEHRDDSRKNAFDPEVAEALKVTKPRK